MTETKYTYKQAQDEFVKTILDMSGKYAPVQIFTDFAEMAAISIANTVDVKPKREKREKKYMDLIQKYNKQEQENFQELIALVAAGLEDKPGDFLGEAFEKIGAASSKAGQFFTPNGAAKIIAKLAFDENKIRDCIAEKGYAGIHEPACGAGATIIAVLAMMKEKGIDFQTQSFTLAQDIDYRCAHICYIQLSLLGAPAIVRVGDTLENDFCEEYLTPYYVMQHTKFFDAVAKAESKPKAQPQKTDTPLTDVEEPKQMKLF